MPTVVNVDTLVPWDLELVIKGATVPTVEPTIGQLRELATLQVALAAGELGEDADEQLRSALKTFVAADRHSALEAAGFFDLEAAMLAASLYFETWQKKKRTAAAVAGLTAAGAAQEEAEAVAAERIERMTAAQNTQALGG